MEDKPAQTCIRQPGHDGPCNGFPRKECEVIAELTIQRDDARHQNGDLFAEKVSLEQFSGRLTREREILRRVCAEAYQLAGAVGAPEAALDNLSDAAQGVPLRHETFLPVLDTDCSVIAELTRQRGELDRLQSHYAKQSAEEFRLRIEAENKEAALRADLEQAYIALGQIEMARSGVTLPERANRTAIQIAELTRQRDEDRDSLRAMETDRHYTGHIAALTARAEAAERERDHNTTSYQASLRLNEHASKLIGEWTARAVSAERERDEEEDKMFEIQNVLENAGFTGGTIVSAVKRLVASVEAATRKTDEMRESMVPEVDHRG